MSSCSSPQSEAVTSVHGEISQKSVLKCENVGNVLINQIFRDSSDRLFVLKI